tara:strand:+ start:226 stop:498 length:273 start_codon:yes stop_codon:yes gene_type:complete
MALDLSENNILFLLRIALVSVILNVALSVVSSFLPKTNSKMFLFKYYDEMVDKLRKNKNSLVSSSVLTGLISAASVLLLPLLLENVEFLR